MSATRHRLGALFALAGGLFLGVALLPVPVTGPVGAWIGTHLWDWFGVGALAFPLAGLGSGLAMLYDEPGGFDGRRAVVVVVGLALLVPFVIGVIGDVRAPDLDPPPAARALTARLTGLVPGLFYHVAHGSVGQAGAALFSAAALAGLAVIAFDWHPLAWLRRPTEQVPAETPAPRPARSGDAPAAALVPVEAGADDEPPEREVAPAPRPARPRKPKPSAPVATATGDDGVLPPVTLLDEPPQQDTNVSDAVLQKLGESLIETLRTFKVEGTIAGRTTGPVVTQFEVVPAPGVKAQRIVALGDDLAMAMRAPSIRVAPIPGKGAVGVEVPNPKPRLVTLRELFESPEWDDARPTLPIALGRDLEGKPVVADLAKMPHLLIAGATGTGKSVGINSIITSLVYRYTPKELRLLMVDPKMVELSIYNALPHLRHGVVTRNEEAATLLKWAVYEMQRRYELLQVNGARNLADFNAKVDRVERGEEATPLQQPKGARPTLAELAREAPDTPPPPPDDDVYREGKLPFIVVVIDELADLMMTVQAEVETPLAMLAQKARAIGIHLILATQRPSVNVITGLIKANFPSRMAFRVASKVDSRTILDQNGAEALLGNGDMLFLPPGRNEPMRLQGAYISTAETERVMAWYRARRERLAAAPAGLVEVDILADMRRREAEGEGGGPTGDTGERDALFRQAAELCLSEQGGSTSLLQRKLGIGYGRAARIMDQLEAAGILGPAEGSKKRDVLIGFDQLDTYCE